MLPACILSHVPTQAAPETELMQEVKALKMPAEAWPDASVACGRMNYTVVSPSGTSKIQVQLFKKVFRVTGTPSDALPSKPNFAWSVHGSIKAAWKAAKAAAAWG